MNIHTPPQLMPPTIEQPYVEVTKLLRIHVPLEVEIERYVSDFVKRQREIDARRNLVLFSPSPKKQPPAFKPWNEDISVMVNGEDDLPKIITRQVRAEGSYRGERRNKARVAYRLLKKEAKQLAREAKAAIAAVTA